MEETEKIRTQLNQHRVELVENIDIRRFLDKLRSRGVLSLEDCQEMTAQQLYPTDRQRAGKFLDVLGTKGQQGYNMFLECIEDHYPHIYKTMTGKEPKRVCVPMSPSVFSYPQGYADLLVEISTHNHQLQEEVNIKTTQLYKLTDERDDLAYQNVVCLEKLKNYQIILQNHKQLENEVVDLKDELLNLYVRFTREEKAKDKYKALYKQEKEVQQLKKEHKIEESKNPLIKQLDESLKDIKVRRQQYHGGTFIGNHVNKCLKKSERVLVLEEQLNQVNILLNSQRSSTDKANSRTEQLSQERNQLQMEMHHIKLKMDRVHCESTISIASFIESSRDLDTDATIELLKQDKEAALREFENVSEELYQVRQEVDQKDIEVDKLEAENHDLKYAMEMVQRNLSATERNYELMWQEMQISNRDCRNAIEQRNQAHAELHMMRQETEQRQEKVKAELDRFKEELYSMPQNHMTNGEAVPSSPSMLAISRSSGRHSFLSESSGISSARTSMLSLVGLAGDPSENPKAETLPRAAKPSPLEHRPSLPVKSTGPHVPHGKSSLAVEENVDSNIVPVKRSRKYQIKRELSNEASNAKLEADTFPANEFLSTRASDIPSGDTDDKESPVLNGIEEESEGASGRQFFADRPQMFSDSLMAHHGSQRKSREFYEAQDTMLKEIRKSVDWDAPRDRKKPAKLGAFSEFLTIDYDDESEELTRIMRNDRMATIKPYNPHRAKESPTAKGDTTPKPPIAAKKPSIKKVPGSPDSPSNPPAECRTVSPEDTVQTETNSNNSNSTDTGTTRTGLQSLGPRQISRKRPGCRKSIDDHKIRNDLEDAQINPESINES